MPFRRHLAGLGRALVEHPAALALLAPGAAIDEVAVAECIGSDLLAMEPGEKPGAERHGTPKVEGGPEIGRHYSQRPRAKQGSRNPPLTPQTPVIPGIFPSPERSAGGSR